MDILATVMLLAAASSACVRADTLRVLNINMWGLPWSEHNQERFEALAEILIAGSYDVVLLQEVWFQHQYDIITTPQVRHILPFVSPFKKMNDALCTVFGATRLLPLECSGLVILSRLPVRNFWYKPYSVRGKLFYDGQFAVRKGLGGATILWNDFLLDITTSHLTTYTAGEYENIWKRAIQAQETVDMLQKSTADFKVKFLPAPKPTGLVELNVLLSLFSPPFVPKRSKQPKQTW